MNDPSPAVQLSSIELFCKAAETHHFAAAAEALGVTPAAVSRAIARLEARLGVRLFARTTRQVRLTEEGRLYHDQCRQALAQIAAVEAALAGRHAEVSGTLRVSLPTTYGHHRVLPRLPTFLHHHPRLHMDVQLTNHNVDFVEEGFDVAVRLGTPPDSRLVARLLEHATLGLFAAPAYLAARGTPRALAELDTHALLPFVRPSSGRPMPWLLRVNGRDVDHGVPAQLRCAGDPLAAVRLAEAGAGIVQTYHFIVAEALARGALVELMPQLGGRTRPFHALYPPHRHLNASVRAFVDFLRHDVVPPAAAPPSDAAPGAAR